MVKVYVTTKFLNGIVIDCNRDEEHPLQFQVGKGEVTKGLDQGIVGLQTATKAIIYCPPEYATGGNSEWIPENESLLFEVEIV